MTTTFRQRAVSLLLVALLAVGMGAAGVGTVTADHADDNEDVLIHENVTADGDLATVWVDVVGESNISTADNTTNVTVTIDGVNHTAGTESELHSETLLIEEGVVKMSEYQLADSDSDDYERLNLTVETQTADHGQYINDSATEWGTTVQFVGGGGGFLGGGGASAGGAIVVVALLGGLVLYARGS